MTSTIIITGATGFVGLPAVRHLLAAGAEVHAIARDNTGPLPAGCRFHAIDLLQAATLDQVMEQIRPTHLLHLAWIATPGSYWTSPANRDWVEASLRLLQTFGKAGGRRAVLIGSCAEYDWTVAERCHETTTPLNPATLYGQCKNELRIRAEEFAEKVGLSTAWARLFFMYGPREHPDRLVASVVRSLLAGQRASCSAGLQQRDFLHVDDVAQALATLLLSEVQGPCNIGSGQPVSVRTVVETLGVATGRSELLKLGERPTPSTEPPLLVAGVGRLTQEVGWTPRFSLEQGLADTVAWWDEHLRGAENKSSPMSPKVKAAQRCPVCNAANTVQFLHRPGVPVHQNLLFSTSQSAREMKRGVLELRACGECGFVFNAAFDDSLLDYGPQYENTQTCSGVFNSYVDELVHLLVDEHEIRTGRVVEIGCGKGGFLLKLLDYPGNQSTGVGFDPSYLGPETARGGRARFMRAFYSAESALPADAVICRHVIEHIPQPLGLLRSVRAALGDSQGAKIFFETPCVEWILRHEVPWDLFYEHCSLFTRNSLGEALTRAGFQVTRIRHVFGGQYLWAEALSTPGQWLNEDSTTLVSLALQFGREQQARIAGWVQLLAELQEAGPIAVWGAGAKGATFCSLADADAASLVGVVDVNPAKQGMFLAGTGHRILAPSEVLEQRIATILVLNPNYVSEVTNTLVQLGSAATVIDMMAKEGTHAANR